MDSFTVSSKAATAFPWRRSPDNLKSKIFSAEAPEYIPGGTEMDQAQVSSDGTRQVMDASFKAARRPWRKDAEAPADSVPKPSLPDDSVCPAETSVEKKQPAWRRQRNPAEPIVVEEDATGDSVSTKPSPKKFAPWRRAADDSPSKTPVKLEFEEGATLSPSLSEEGIGSLASMSTIADSGSQSPVSPGTSRSRSPATPSETTGPEDEEKRGENAEEQTLGDFFQSKKSGKKKKGASVSKDAAPAAAATPAEVSDQQLPVEAQATTEEHKDVAEAPAAVSVQDMLRWRSFAPCAKPAEVDLSAQAFEPSEPIVEDPVADATPTNASVEDATPSSKPSLRPGAMGMSWRASATAKKSDTRQHEDDAPVEKSWRNVEKVRKLEVSEKSWVAQQRARKSSQENASDEEVVRAMKAILNKLTLEKFDSLSKQLIDCGITSANQLQLLIEEIFEKATTQHHFCNMYADLCVVMHNHFTTQPMVEVQDKSFKKILLTCCQVSFEKHLVPPEGLASMQAEERIVAERSFKMCAIGNIKFVGALLVRKMLASKVMLAIMEELLQDPTSEALESLAALLMVVGPAFDVPDWTHRVAFNAIFLRVEKIAKSKSTDKRIRCLLRDVLDVRQEGWNDRRPKQIEGPSKLQEVAAKVAGEDGSPCASPQKSISTSTDGWSTVGGARNGIPTADAQPRIMRLAAEKHAKDSEKLAASKSPSSEKTPKKEKKEKKETEASAQFDKEQSRKELEMTLAELRVSHDVSDAVLRLAGINMPEQHQAGECAELLSRISEEGSVSVRKAGFDVVVHLFLDRHWKPESARKGFQIFLEDLCADLKCDVPALPSIVKEEFKPAAARLAEAGLVDSSQLEAWLCAL